MNNDAVDEYAGHTRLCKGGEGGVDNAGDGQVWHPRTVRWQRSTGRFCGFKMPYLNYKGRKNRPAADILPP